MNDRQATTRLTLHGLRLRAGGAPGGRTLFDALDLVVHPGECWSVVGPNGSGKSSLLAAIAGVMSLDAGDIRLDGEPLATWSADALAARRAWCPAVWLDPFPATVAETAALALDRGRRPFASFARRTTQRDVAVQALLERLDLAALASADVATLSAGERQRLALATTLAQGAPLLLLDEPASHLDPAHRVRLLELLGAHARAGGSVISTAHDLDLAWDGCSHAVVLDGRGGAAAGPRAELLTSQRMSDVFGTPIRSMDVDGRRHFASSRSV